MANYEGQLKKSISGIAIIGFRTLLSLDVLIALGVLFRFAQGGANGVVQAISHAMRIERMDQVTAALGDFTAIICALLLITVVSFFGQQQIGIDRVGHDKDHDSLARA